VIPDQFFDRTRGRISTFFGDRGRHRNARRHLSVHGRSRVFDQGRIEHLPHLGDGRDRYD
jgi:hypothetical protein